MTDYSHCIVQGDGVSGPILEDKKSRFDIVLLDSSNTAIDAEPEVRIIDSSGAALLPFVACKATGKYRVTYVPSLTGQHHIHVAVAHQPLAGSPWSVAVVSAAVDDNAICAERCVVSGDGVRRAICGQRVEFHVELRNAAGEAVLLDDGVDVFALLECEDADDVDVDVELRDDGVWQCAFVAPESAGERVLHVGVEDMDDELANSPYVVQFVAPADAEEDLAALQASLASTRVTERVSLAGRVALDNDEEWRRSTAGNLALHDAALVGNLPAVRKLIEKHAFNVDVKNDDGRTPLYLAAWSGFRNIVEWLCDHGANVDLATRAGFTPLFAAAERERLLVTTMLLEQYQCSPNKLSNQNTTALFHSAARGHDGICRVLLDAGADCNGGVEGGWRPLHAAIYYTRRRVLDVLLDQDELDVNVPQRESLKGYAPLHLAVARETPFKSAIAKLLAHHSANVDAKTNNHMTPLMLAAMWGHTDVCLLLLESGADHKLRNKKGRTALEVALREARNETAKYLAKATNVDLDDLKEALVGQVLSPRRTKIRTPTVPQSPSDALMSDLEAAANKRK